jgi:radical SAM protein with 4Fe4S-binding SPASM domain
MRGMERYRRYAGSRRVAVIAVVTRASIDRASDIFHFFKALEAEVQLDIYDVRWLDLVQPGSNRPTLIDLAPSPKEVGNFLIELFDLWFYDQDGLVDFKELRQEVKMILQPEIDRGDPFHKRRCDFRRLIFAPNGLAFSCDQWINDEKTSLGDIRKTSLEDILKRKALLWQEIKRRVRKSGEAMGCAECEWGRQCGGGCITCMKYHALLLQAGSRRLPDSSWAEGELPVRWKDIRGETYYCDGLRAFRLHVQEAVRRELRDAD